MNPFKQLLIVASTFVSSTLSFAQIPQVAATWTGLYNDEQKISLFMQQKGSDITGYILKGKFSKLT